MHDDDKDMTQRMGYHMLPVVPVMDAKDTDHCVQWAFWACRECGAQGPVFRMDVLHGMDRDNFEEYQRQFPEYLNGFNWDVTHNDAMSHRRFYRWTLERSRAEIFRL
jgi:hypothetical protein